VIVLETPLFGPFDRMIIATALELDARLASVDSAFSAYEALSGRLIA